VIRATALVTVACVAAAASVTALAAQPAPTPRVYSLAGEWRFLLDPKDTGIADRVWQAGLPDRITLPGSTDQARYGTPNRRPADFQRPSRLFEYTGAAWYQRDVVVPYAWRRRRITLFLERCHWETRVWVDGKPVGMRDSLSTPHIYDITSVATAGKHRITIRVDNRMKYTIGAWASAVSEESQTNWNGIIGRIELRGTARVWIEGIQTYPDPASQTVRVVATVRNVTGKGVTVALNHTVAVHGETAGAEHAVASGACGPGLTRIEKVVSMGDRMVAWSEFTPRVCTLTTALKATDGTTTWVHDSSTEFGMRSISTDKTHIMVNGRRTFLRGTVECCVFPLTGFPPTDTASWARIFGIARSYGLNHMRFHSWCPPEAAFAAADAAGFLLQVEAPLWSGDIGPDKVRDAFIGEEMERILDTYGSHPSFGMFCIGNELTGDAAGVHALVDRGRKRDPRHLYTSSTAFSLGERDDFSVAAFRGLRGAGTNHDFRNDTRPLNKPVVAHEIGQWSVFPDIREVGRYVGTLHPGNLMRIQDGLRRAGLLSLAPMLVRATGHASAELYKEEIEAQLRNPDGAGFQMLGLHDFPGHGTATVGLLSAFWESKGLIAPEAFRRFCSPTTPLVRMAARTFTTDQALSARVEVSHFGPRDLADAVVEWRLRRPEGTEVAGGTFAPRRIRTGGLTEVGSIEKPFGDAAVPARLMLEVAIRGTSAANSWPIWVYPAGSEAAASTGPTRAAQSSDSPVVVVAGQLDGRVLQALRDGRKVILMGPASARRSVKGSATPVFWSPILFPAGPLTMGILCDPAHPALAAFPSEAWTERQWHEVIELSRSMVIGDPQGKLDPIVRVIDNFARNLPLALIAEARVGPGRLLVCGADLNADLSARPAAAQLRRSLMAYAASAPFDPRMAIGEPDLVRLFPSVSDDESRVPGRPATAGAVLHVRAALAARPDETAAWSPSADVVPARQAGFGYTVTGGVYREGQNAGWHDASALTVTVTTPKGFEGDLTLHFHDWNGQRRAAQVEFEGRFVESLADYAGAGVWLRMRVTRADTADGRVVLISRPEGVNDIISELVLTPRTPTSGSGG